MHSLVWDQLAAVYGTIDTPGAITGCITMGNSLVPLWCYTCLVTQLLADEPRQLTIVESSGLDKNL